MSTPIQVGEDPWVIPVTTTETDENGNTVITGYPSNGAVSEAPAAPEKPVVSGVGVPPGDDEPMEPAP